MALVAMLSVVPVAAMRRVYVQRQREERQLAKDLEKLRDIPCVTPDGIPLSLWMNTGLRQDIAKALKSSAEGVGLYRTEIPFLDAFQFPDRG